MPFDVILSGGIKLGFQSGYWILCTLDNRRDPFVLHITLVPLSYLGKTLDPCSSRVGWGKYTGLIVLPCLCELPNIFLWNLQSSWIATVSGCWTGAVDMSIPVLPSRLHSLSLYHDELLTVHIVFWLNLAGFVWDWTWPLCQNSV